MRVKLVVMKGQHEGTEIRVHKPRFMIGRHEHCHMSITSSKVSVRHCVILTTDEGVLIRDMGSTNGTYVNGVRIHGSQELRHGDYLKIASLKMQVKIKGERALAEKPKSVSEVDAAKLMMRVSKEESNEGLVGLNDSQEYGSTVMMRRLAAE
jgi:pSer/pThr/pTyr-binding forkhead associated (FHA) protein